MPISLLSVASLSLGLALLFFLLVLLSLLWGSFGVLRNPVLSRSRLFPTLVFWLIRCTRPFFLLRIKAKFLSLLRHILSSGSIDVNTLLRLSGNFISFSRAVPVARLYTNEVNIAIGKGIRRSRPIVVSGPLRDKITHCLFLESWDGYVPWRKDFHHQLKLCTDASSFAWGCVFSPIPKALAPSHQCKGN